MISKFSSFLLNKSNLPTPITCIPVWSPSSSVNGTNSTVTRGRNLENGLSSSLTFPIWYIIFYVYIAKGVHELLNLLPLLSKCWGCRYMLPCLVSVVLGIELSVLCMLGNYYQLNHIPKFASVSLVHTQGFFISIFYRVRFTISSYHQLVFICSPGTKPKAFHKVQALWTRTVNCPLPCYHF